MKYYTAMIAGLALVGASVAMADSSSYPSAPKTTSSAMATLDPDAIEGKDVMDSSGQQLGDVDEVVEDATNGHMAVIGLENSNKEVAIPVTKLSLSADGKKLSTTMTRAQLEALPDYDPMDKESVPE
jgi:sporulation protein YlmC with PRC-barrel domain